MSNKNVFIFPEWNDVISTQKGKRRYSRKGKTMVFPLCERCFENTVQCEYHPGMVVVCGDCEMAEDLQKIKERMAQQETVS